MAIKKTSLLFLFIFLVCASRDLFTTVDAIPITSEDNHESLEATHEDILPAAIHEDILPEATHEDILPEATDEDILPEVASEGATEIEDASAEVDLTQHHDPNISTESQGPKPIVLELDSPLLKLDDIRVTKIAKQAFATMLPAPVQGIVAPELVMTEHDANKTDTQIRKETIIKNAIPYALATGAGVAISSAAMAAVTGTTIGAGSIPALAISGALSGVAADKVYKWSNRVARLRQARKGKSDVDRLINTDTGKKTEEELQIEEEIAIDEDKTFKDKVKEVLPVALGGATGAVAGGLVGEVVGATVRHVFAKPKVSNAMVTTARTITGAGSAALATKAMRQGTDIVMSSTSGGSRKQ
jgi:hypothetical protein